MIRGKLQFGGMLRVCFDYEAFFHVTAFQKMLMRTLPTFYTPKLRLNEICQEELKNILSGQVSVTLVYWDSHPNVCKVLQRLAKRHQKRQETWLRGVLFTPNILDIQAKGFHKFYTNRTVLINLLKPGFAELLNYRNRL